MPDTTIETVLDLAEFALLAGSAATALLCLWIWRSRRTRRPIAFGASLCLFFATTALMTDRLLPLLGLRARCIWRVAHAGRAGLPGRCLRGRRRAPPLRLVRPPARRRPLGRAQHPDRAGQPRHLRADRDDRGGADLPHRHHGARRDVGRAGGGAGLLGAATLSEVFAGLALNVSRPFRIGDSVQVDGVWGVVVESGWRSVGLRTYEGTLVTLPTARRPRCG